MKSTTAAPLPVLRHDDPRVPGLRAIDAAWERARAIQERALAERAAAEAHPEPGHDARPDVRVA